MDNYLCINVIISSLALALIRYGQGSNIANYYLSAFAIFAWFIPYPLIASLIPTEVLLKPDIIALTSLNLSAQVTTVSEKTIDTSMWLSWGVFTLLFIGVVIFFQKLRSALTWQKGLRAEASLCYLAELSSEHNVPVYQAQSISTGLLLGIINPIIVISSKVQSNHHKALIIAHEKQHLQSKDNIKILLLEATSCLFWWNPLVRKLVDINSFYIEVRCDEKASQHYGKQHYLEDLAALLLSSRTNKIQHFTCSVSSTTNNNIARIKRLKETNHMSFKKKLTYALMALTTTTVISWNTLATATNHQNSQMSKTAEQLGALVDFDIVITNKEIGELADSYHNKMTLWMHFNKKSTITIGDNFAVNIKIDDLGDKSFLSYELIENTQSNEKIVSKPQLTVHYGKAALVEIDNSQVSQYAYAIKATTTKAKNPSLTN